MKKYGFKIRLIIGLLLFCWILFSQSCMKFRISDDTAKKQFAINGVLLYTNTIKVNGSKLHYAKTGNDSMPTLFFIHGSPGSWDAFSVYMQDKDLLAKYRMISIDRPGFGFSQFGNAKNLSQQSIIISVLLKHFQNNKPFCVVGHSYGGPLAIKLAADNPGFFKDIVLLAASVDPSEEQPERWRGFFLNSSLQFLLPGAFKPSNEEIWYLKKDLFILAHQFANITSHIWIVHGDKDSFVPVGNAAYAKKMLISAKSIHTTILKDAPHFIPWKPWYDDVKRILLKIPTT